MGIFNDTGGYGNGLVSRTERSRAEMDRQRQRRDNRKSSSSLMMNPEGLAIAQAQAEEAKMGMPFDTANQGSDDTLNQIQMGLSNATGTLQPQISQGQQLSGELQNLLMGKTPIDQIPGYNAMSDARRQAVGDLGTGMAGTGKFFSGTTAQGAADIGGAMQNQLMQQRIQNLMMGAQPGQQMQSQLGGMQMGAGSNIANLMMGQQQMQQQQQQADDANKGAFWGDVLGLAGTVGGFMMGGPPGAAVGGGIAAGIGAGGS